MTERHGMPKLEGKERETILDYLEKAFPESEVPTGTLANTDCLPSRPAGPGNSQPGDRSIPRRSLEQIKRGFEIALAIGFRIRLPAAGCR
jgi:hypothetical protein